MNDSANTNAQNWRDVMNVPEKHKAIAHAWVDGAKIEVRNPKSPYPELKEWQIIKVPSWLEDCEYRIKPTKPSINWEHVAPEYVALATDSDGNGYLFTKIPEASAHMWMAFSTWTGAEAFQSFVKGTCDWKDSLVLRPSQGERP